MRFLKISFLTMNILVALNCMAQSESSSTCNGIISLDLKTVGPCGWFNCFDSENIGLIKLNIYGGLDLEDWEYIVWDFGDGSPVETQTPDAFAIEKNHTYLTTGTFTVTATIHLNCPDLTTETVVLSKTFHSVDSFDNLQYYATKIGEYEYTFTYSGSYYDNSDIAVGGGNAILDFGDGDTELIPYESLTPGTILATHLYVYETEGIDLTTNLSLSQYSHPGCYCSIADTVIIQSPPCDCFSFKPEGGKEYWFSAWVQEEHIEQVKTYSEASIQLVFVTDISSTSIDFYPTGEIIDGWQRIVGKFTMPAGFNQMEVKLVAHSTVDTYFDDIRIHPFNGSMKSYVYDGETFWLTSELDDNNYATFYEYDEEGGLIRIKKETARGIVTIQETRSNTIKNELPAE